MEARKEGACVFAALEALAGGSLEIEDGVSVCILEMKESLTWSLKGWSGGNVMV